MGMPGLHGPIRPFDAVTGQFRESFAQEVSPTEAGGKISAISESALSGGYLGVPLSLGFQLALFPDALANLQAEGATFGARTDRSTMRAKPSGHCDRTLSMPRCPRF